MIEASVVGSWAATAVVAFLAIFDQRRREKRAVERENQVRLEASSAREDVLTKAKEDLAKSFQDAMQDWKSRYELEHSELMAYRKDTHDNSKRAQASILMLTEENAALKARTDLGPLVTHNEQVAKSLLRIGEMMGLVLRKLDITMPSDHHSSS